MRHPLPNSFCIIALLLATSYNLFSQQAKYALVIGVQNYSSIKQLRHSLNDANDIASVLESRGFKVDLLRDPKTNTEIKAAIRRYFNTVTKGTVGIIYYSGHATVHDGNNYLIPANAQVETPADLDDQCVKMDYVMNSLNTNDNLNILILDACRTNDIKGVTKGITDGLVSVDPPQGSIVLFAAQPGHTASDGTGRNGLFTSKLLRYINEPNLDISAILKKVKQDVHVESNGTQLPSYVDNSLGGDFYFNRITTQLITQPIVKTESAYVAPAATTLELLDKAVKFYKNKNYAEAVPLFHQAAEQGNAKGQYSLGTMYKNGQGVTQNNKEAVSWFRKAAEQGNVIGQYNLGDMYANGQGVAQNYTEAVSWYRKAAEQGNARGQYYLGTMYHNGQGVTQNNTEAASWFRKAAEQGHATGQCILGLMYASGRDVLQNYTEAVSWFRKAAEQGDAAGQYYLGYMFANGQGVAQNYAEAVSWYRKAAEQGHADGQYNLGFMYENGQGVAQNYAEAVSWYRKATGQGFEKAKEGLKRLESR